MLNQSSPELFIWEILPSRFSDQLLWIHINYLLHLYLTLVVQLCLKIHPFLLVSQFKVIQILKAHLNESLNFLSFCWYCSLFISNFINIGLFSFFCLILLGIVIFFKGSIHGLFFLNFFHFYFFYFFRVWCLGYCLLFSILKNSKYIIKLFI